MSNRKAGQKLAIVPESVMLRLSGEMADVLEQLEELQETAATLKSRIADIEARELEDEAEDETEDDEEEDEEEDDDEATPAVDLAPIESALSGMKGDMSKLAEAIAALQNKTPPKPEPRGPIRIRVTRRDVNDNILEVETY